MEELPIEYDSLTDDEIRQQVNIAEESIKKAELLIKNLQNSCKHNAVGVLIVNKTLRNVCQLCNGPLDYPNADEIEKAGYV
jgi:hypothetical protein